MNALNRTEFMNRISRRISVGWAGFKADTNQSLLNSECDSRIKESVFPHFKVSMTDLQKTNHNPKKTAGSLFTNFEEFRLTDEERVYLNAAALGDAGVLRMFLDSSDSEKLNVNCVDYMGRNSLHLAVDSENAEIIELLLDKLNFECIEEALLHAISKGHTKIERLIIEHPNFMAKEDQIRRIDFNNAFFRTTEKSQFSPDITPLILAAHYNNHEMIQMFLSRQHIIERPHSISCQCSDCQVKQDYDSLKRSRSRLNAYRALASPAFMALSSPDPIMTTFELRQEMMKLAEVEKEFKIEYLMLVEQCMNFACQMMDLCRGTQEVEAVISDCLEDSTNIRDPLGRLRLAIRYEEKKFVAHPNCQQYLTSIWYGPDTAFLQSWSLMKKISLSILATPLFPIFCLMYIIVPKSFIARAMRCPSLKFATHVISHFLFLIFLSAATFRLEEKNDLVRSTENLLTVSDSQYVDKVDILMKEKLRPANTVITHVQICIVLWVAGMFLSEIKQVYFSGLRLYIGNFYNILNFAMLNFYMASYTLRIIVDRRVREADRVFNATEITKEALLSRKFDKFNKLLAHIESSIRTEDRYFMEPSRFNWMADDPEIVSDILFAIANVITFARTTYFMPAFEVLGPLQISFIRMLADITRFMVLFLLVLFAFMVGLYNLFWYYGSQVIVIYDKSANETKEMPATEAFEGLKHTLYTLFWSMFGQISLSSVPIKHPPVHDKPVYGVENQASSTSIVEGVGVFLLGIYHVIIIIVLVNMLIAMMSHSFEDIQKDCDVEWKFARTKLWLNYIDNGSTLPAPFNVIPTRNSFLNAFRFMKTFANDGQHFNTWNSRSTDFIRTRRKRVCMDMDLVALETSYKEIMQRLVRRYLFKMERERDFEDKPKDMLIRADEVSGQNADNIIVFGDSPHENSSRDESSNINLNQSLTRRSTSNRRNTMIGQVKNSISMASHDEQISPPYSQANQSSPNQASAKIQVISLPQLDNIQRSQKILDMRLQNLQAQSDQLNCASGNTKIKEEIQHVRTIMNESQKALKSIIVGISQIQEQMCMLNNNMEQWFLAQASGQRFQTIVINEKRPSNGSSREKEEASVSSNRSAL